ncbi:MAG: glycosyltransferase family 4 protein [Bacteroidales bacterium]|jgi:glycosyltransferase involved in cell wall biosynthesis
MQKVLIITYYWPPSSGAGVQRWLKFSKYLPSFGWEPVILTIDPSYAAYPAVDPTLEKDVNGGIKVYKTSATDYFRLYRKDKSRVPSAGFATSGDPGILIRILRFVRGNFFIPDPRRGWNRSAFRKACEIVQAENIKHIITTSPPHSTQLVGLKLKKRYPSVKWIADLRDPWTDIYYYSLFYHTPIARAIDKGYEKRILRSADRIITVGKTLRDLFASKLPGIKNKISVITNGFDEDDFTGISVEDPEKLTVTYTGTLSDSYPLNGFLAAASDLKKNGTDIRLRFIGTVSQRQKDLIIAETGPDSAEFIPHVDHVAAIRYMHESTALLLIIPDHSSGKCILTGKLFEYIAARKPVICLGPIDGDAAEIITGASSGAAFEHYDSASILGFLEQIRDNKFKGSSEISEFSRRSLTSALVNILQEI